MCLTEMIRLSLSDAPDQIFYVYSIHEFGKGKRQNYNKKEGIGSIWSTLSSTRYSILVPDLLPDSFKTLMPVSSPKKYDTHWVCKGLENLERLATIIFKVYKKPRVEPTRIQETLSLINQCLLLSFTVLPLYYYQNSYLQDCNKAVAPTCWLRRLANASCNSVFNDS